MVKKQSLSIYIPTFRRTERQVTVRYLPDEFIPYTSFVCVVDEAERLHQLFPDISILVQPKEIKSIAKKRAWLFETCKTDKMFMFDDDLRFCMRDPKLPFTKLHICYKDDPYLAKALWEVIDKLDDYAHVGISPRQGNNHHEEAWAENGRAIYALGFQPAVVRKHCVLGRIEHREDMDITLQLLRKGFKNIISYNVCLNQAGWQAKGGASEDRTIEASNADAFKLAQLHPGLVSVNASKYKYSINRIEVDVSWKKAYASSRSKGFFG